MTEQRVPTSAEYEEATNGPKFESAFVLYSYSEYDKCWHAMFCAPTLELCQDVLNHMADMFPESHKPEQWRIAECAPIPF